MASYVVLGRSGEGAPLVQVSIGSIDQEQPVMTEQAVVDAVRERLLLRQPVISTMSVTPSARRAASHWSGVIGLAMTPPLRRW